MVGHFSMPFDKFIQDLCDSIFLVISKRLSSAQNHRFWFPKAIRVPINGAVYKVFETKPECRDRLVGQGCFSETRPVVRARNNQALRELTLTFRSGKFSS